MLLFFITHERSLCNGCYANENFMEKLEHLLHFPKYFIKDLEHNLIYLELFFRHCLKKENDVMVWK